MKSIIDRQVVERRQFGRRQTTIFGWLRIKGRPKLPCLVRNFSVKGALLELEVPSWLPFNFDLQIEGLEQLIKCEIRHVQQHSLGVTFVREARPEVGSLCSGAASIEEAWMGNFATSLEDRTKKGRPTGSMQKRLGAIMQPPGGLKNVR